MDIKNQKIINVFNAIADLFLVSVLWVISSVPIITIGASCSTAYNVVVEVIRKKNGYVFSKYWKDFRVNFTQSLPYSLIFVMIMAAEIVCTYFLWDDTEHQLVFLAKIACLLTGSLTAVYFSYAFSIIGRFRLNSKQVGITAFRMTFTSFLWNLLLFIIIACFLSLELYYPPTLLLLPGCYFFIMSYLQEKRFHLFINYKNDIEVTEDV